MALRLRGETPDELLAEWDKEVVAWKADNDANAAKLEMRNAIGQRFCEAMLGVVLAAVAL